MPGFRAIQILFAVAFLTVSLTQAQVIPQRQTSVDLLVRVTFDNDRAAGDRIRVELVSEMGTPVGENFTNAEGRVSFHITAPGNYLVKASGIPIEGTVSENIRIDDMDKNR